ncbi:hypothetical protein ASF35_01895 [Aeromicrobium sp. Leaf291]|nr:hypothetical protein ASF35_01895 [Aeromicrobium sp. Leaf291]
MLALADLTSWCAWSVHDGRLATWDRSGCFELPRAPAVDSVRRQRGVQCDDLGQVFPGLSHAPGAGLLVHVLDATDDAVVARAPKAALAPLVVAVILVSVLDRSWRLSAGPSAVQVVTHFEPSFLRCVRLWRGIFQEPICLPQIGQVASRAH